MEIINIKEQLANDLTNRLNLLSPEAVALKLDEKIFDLTNRLNVSVYNYLNKKTLVVDNLSKRLKSELLLNYINNDKQYYNIYN